MLIRVCLFMSLLFVQSNLAAMGGGKDGASGESKRASAKKYTYELCTARTAGSGDRARIAMLIDQARKEVQETVKDEKAEHDELEKDKKAEAARIALANTILANSKILVARYETTIVGFLMFADKNISEKSGVVPVSKKMRAKEYCTIVELGVDAAHKTDALAEQLAQYFAREIASTLTPKPVDIYCAQPEVSGPTRSNFDWRYNLAKELGRSAAARDGYREQVERSSRGGGSARGGCCLFDCN